MSKSRNEKGSHEGVQLTLDEVLQAYVLSDEAPSRQTLPEWIQRYPHYKQELISLTARWSLATHLPDVQEQDEVDEATLILRGMSIVQNVLYTRPQTRAVELDCLVRSTPVPDKSSVESQAAATSPHLSELRSVTQRESAGTSVYNATRLPIPIRGLISEGARCGLTVDALAGQTGLSVSLLAKLERRVIVATSIPRMMSERIAKAVRREPSAVMEYSRLTPTFAHGAQHRSNKAPVLPREPQDFFDAVRSDPELTVEQRRALLALEDKGV
jgi:hypothetical protein